MAWKEISARKVLAVEAKEPEFNSQYPRGCGNPVMEVCTYESYHRETEISAIFWLVNLLESRFSERPCLKKKVGGSNWRHSLDFWFPCTCMQSCIYTGTHIWTYTYVCGEPRAQTQSLLAVENWVWGSIGYTTQHPAESYHTHTAGLLDSCWLPENPSRKDSYEEDAPYLTCTCEWNLTTKASYPTFSKSWILKAWSPLPPTLNFSPEPNHEYTEVIWDICQIALKIFRITTKVKSLEK